MITLMFGLIILGAPFLALGAFGDKKRGFLYILCLEFLFLAILAVLTQFLGIFYYWIIIGACAVADILALIYLFKNKKISFGKFAIDWWLVAVLVISFLSLIQVHYNYTGKINLATDQTVSYHEVKNMKYIYPYFSDEWYSVLLTKNSIALHTLPVKNFDNTFFLNLELFFHSLVAEIMLILGLDPLTSYAILSVFASILIIVLAYLFLRLSNISNFSSAFCSLSLLYITSGANLPGMWNLIPVNSGVIFSLMGFCFLAMGSLAFAGISLALVMFFYPPIFIFLALGVAIAVFMNFSKDKEKIFKIIAFVGAAILLLGPVAYILLMLSPAQSFVSLLAEKLVYVSFSGNNNPNFNLYYVAPLQIILFALLGLGFVYKNKKWLFYPFLLLLAFWIAYSLMIYRFVAEYEKIVFFASIIAGLIAGFGAEYAKEYLQSKIKTASRFWPTALQIGILSMFLIFAPFYTQRESWINLVMTSRVNGAVFYPKAPANNYLTGDDLRIFSGISKARFLSIPWKGTVIGVATGNYPAVSKEGNISIGRESDYYLFLRANCAGKKTLAKELKADYVYTYDFDCAGFEKLDQSQEGLFLFKVL